MALKVKLAKKINGTLQVIRPNTDAEVVVYDDSLTVKDVLDALVDAVDNIESSLYLDTVYITTADGSIVTDDGGTGTVAVAGLTAVEVTSSTASTTSDDSSDSTSDSSDS